MRPSFLALCKDHSNRKACHSCCSKFGRPRLPGAPRLEFEQAILRVVISAAVLADVGWYVGRDGVVSGDEVQALIAAVSFFAFAGAITLRILQAPGISKARRILGIVVDNAVASYGIFVLGEGGAVIFGTYLFITLGNGFRYGRFYLHLSQVLSVTGFAFVMLASPLLVTARVDRLGLPCRSSYRAILCRRPC